MKLTVKRQNFQEVPSWGIFHGDVFACYSLTRLGAERAKKELETTIRVQRKQLTQAAIDTRPGDQEPMGTIRRLIWRAVQVS